MSSPDRFRRSSPRRPTLQFVISDAQQSALEQRRAGGLRLRLAISGHPPTVDGGFRACAEAQQPISLDSSESVPSRRYSRYGESVTTNFQRPDGTGGPLRSPGDIRNALQQYATKETLAIYDQQVERASHDATGRHGGEPLAKILERWRHAVLLATGAIKPEHRGQGREQFVDAWEAAHPGEKLSEV